MRASSPILLVVGLLACSGGGSHRTVGSHDACVDAVRVCADPNAASFRLPNEVRIDTGLISGTPGNDAAVTVFKGIPYAAPPVGELRWKEPVAAASWSGVRACDSFGDNAMQAPAKPALWWTEEFMPRDLPYSEDCLTLNVWTESTSTSGKRPVLVFIHGGAYVSGSGSCPVYDGEALAKKGVVFVTVNYRLGIFGFLAHPDLTAESPNQTSGDYGVLDVIAALKWVKRNIGSFGGDPENVTVQGQSAGSSIVQLLTVSPLATGTFQRTITQSFDQMRPGGTALLAAKEAEGRAAFSGMALAEMRSMNAADVLALPWNTIPVVEGYVLPTDVLSALKAGTQNDVPMITGAVSGDADLFGDTTAIATKTDYESWAKTMYGGRATAFFAAYPASDDAAATAAHAASEVDKRAALEYALARARALHGAAPTFPYFFDHSIPAPPDSAISTGAFHSADIPYSINYFYTPSDPQKLRAWTEVDHDLGDTMSSYWANYATGGDPNGAGLPVWSAYADDIHPQEFGDTVHVRVMNDVQTSFWKDYVTQEFGF